MADLLEQFPELQISHVSGNSLEQFERQLTVDDLDIVLCHVPGKHVPDTLIGREISDNRIGALVSANYIDSDCSSLPSSYFAESFRWVTPRDDVIKPPSASIYWRSASRLAPIKVVAENLQLIRRLTLSSRCVGFMPLHIAERELQSGDLVELYMEGASIDRPITALVKKSSRLTPLAESFIDVAQKVFAKADRSEKPHRTVQLV